MKPAPKLTPEAIRLIEKHESRCDGVLARAWNHQVERGKEPVLNRTPLDEVVGREARDPLSTQGAAEEARLAEEWRIRRSAHDMLLEYIFADGPRPDRVIRRVYALAKAVRADLIWDMSYEDLGLMLAETRAAQAWRFDKIICGTLKAAGFLGFRFPHQKGLSAIPHYAAAQKGNSNRRGGKKAAPKNHPATTEP